jgi:hypothetical protein
MNGTRACDNGRLNAPVIETPLAATAIEHSLYLVSRNTRDVRETGAAVFTRGMATRYPTLAAQRVIDRPLTSGAFPLRFRWRIKASKTGAIGPTQGLPAE